MDLQLKDEIKGRLNAYLKFIILIPLDQTDERHGGKVKFSKLIQMLDSDDESSVLNSLNKLCSLTAFKEFQVRFLSLIL